LVWISDGAVSGELLITRQRAEAVGAPAPLPQAAVVAALRSAWLPGTAVTWDAHGQCIGDLGAGVTVRYGGDPLLAREIAGPWGAVRLRDWRILEDGLLPGRLEDAAGAWSLELRYGVLSSASSAAVGKGGEPARPQ
jgi:hypothetical protein